MLIATLRRIAAVFTVLSFVGGATVQALPPSDLLSAPSNGTMAGMADCEHMAMATQPEQQSGSTLPLPCKGMTPDCLKWMGCIGFPSLPASAGEIGVRVEHGRIDYWSAAPMSAGVSVEPDLLPPIAA